MKRTLIIRRGGLLHQHHISTLMRYLNRRGLDLTFLSLGAEPGGVEHLVSSSGLSSFLKSDTTGKSWLGQLFADAFAIRRALKDGGYQQLYVIDSWTLPALFIAKWLLFAKLPARKIYHTYDMLTQQAHGRLYFNLENWYARSANEILVTDPARAAIFRHAHGIERRVHALPIRMMSDAEMPARSAQLRQSIIGDGEADVTLLAYPTSIERSRCSLEVIAALEHLPAHFHLVTFEGGAQVTASARDLAQRIDVEDRLHILPRMPFEQMLEIVASSDLGMIFHDAHSGLGNFFSHPGRLAYLLALDLPIVATAVPSLEAVIYKYGLGQCCDPQSPQELAATVAKAVEERQTRAPRTANQQAELTFEHVAGPLFDHVLFDESERS